MIQFFLRTKLFIPRGHYATIYDIDFQTLYHNIGKRVLLIDLDNTLIPYDEIKASPKQKTFIKKLKTMGYEIVLISNNRTYRVKHYADDLGVRYVANAKKPLKSGFKKAMRHTDSYYQKGEMLVIGDQLMTDVYGARRCGYDVILVKPIRQKTEKWYTRLNRWLEQKMLKKIKRKYPDIYEALKLDTRYE